MKRLSFVLLLSSALLPTASGQYDGCTPSATVTCLVSGRNILRQGGNRVFFFAQTYADGPDEAYYAPSVSASVAVPSAQATIILNPTTGVDSEITLKI